MHTAMDLWRHAVATGGMVHGRGSSPAPGTAALEPSQRWGLRLRPVRSCLLLPASLAYLCPAEGAHANRASRGTLIRRLLSLIGV